MSETIIDLIRHGEPVGGQRLRGAQDDPLSDLGWQQMRDAVADHRPWNSIVSSPLLRCCRFAETLATESDLPLELRDEFREIGFGTWEGKTTAELMQTDPDALKRYWQDPDRHTPPEGEKLSDFVQRVHHAWHALVEQSQDQHRLLVCHGGVIRAIMVAVLGMPNNRLWNIDVPYANVSRIVIHEWKGEKSAQLRFHQARLM